MQIKAFSPGLKIWLIFTVVSAILCGLIYAAVQQNFRTGANDPQIEIAEEVAKALSQGQDPAGVVPPYAVDPSSSLSTFMMVFDQSGKSLASSAQLDGKSPTPPSGVFDYVKAHGENRLTWQPKTGVRVAAVVTKYSNNGSSGYVLAGRSLKEVEIREKNLLLLTVAAWLAIAAISLALALLLFRQKPLEPGMPKKE